MLEYCAFGEFFAIVFGDADPLSAGRSIIAS
jgi:hypothetical protein